MRLFAIDAPVDPCTRLEMALLHEQLFDPLHAVSDGEEVIDVIDLHAKRFAHGRFVALGWNRHRDFGYVGLRARHATRLGVAAETHIVTEIQTIAVVALPDAPRLEPRA